MICENSAKCLLRVSTRFKATYRIEMRWKGQMRGLKEIRDLIERSYKPTRGPTQSGRTNLETYRQYQLQHRMATHRIVFLFELYMER